MTPGARTPQLLPRRTRTYEWADPVGVDMSARGLDGLAYLRAVARGELPPPPIAATLGFQLVMAEPGEVALEFGAAEFTYNPVGTLHGGVCAALCDSACGCAVQSLLPASDHHATLDLHVRFIRPITAASGRLRCAGTVEHLGERTALATARVARGDGKPFAVATSCCMIFRSAASQ